MTAAHHFARLDKSLNQTVGCVQKHDWGDIIVDNEKM